MIYLDITILFFQDWELYKLPKLLFQSNQVLELDRICKKTVYNRVDLKFLNHSLSSISNSISTACSSSTSLLSNPVRVQQCSHSILLDYIPKSNILKKTTLIKEKKSQCPPTISQVNFWSLQQLRINFQPLIY